MAKKGGKLYKGPGAKQRGKTKGWGKPSYNGVDAPRTKNGKPITKTGPRKQH